LKITTNAIWLISCRVSADLISLLLFILIARHFGPSGVGTFSYAFAIATFLFMLTSLGLDTYGLQQYSQVPVSQRSRWIAELLGAQVLVVLTAVVAVTAYVAFVPGSAVTGKVIFLLSAYQITAAISRTLFIPAMAAEHMAVPALADVISKALALGAALFVIRFHPSGSVATAMLGFPIAAGILLGIAVQSLLRHHLKPAVVFSTPALRRIGRTLWSFAAAEVVFLIFMRIGLVALSILAGEAATGLYAAGLKLLELACVPLVLMGFAAYPRLIRLHAMDPAAFRRLAGNILWIAVLVAGGIAWALYFIAPALLVPVLGAKFTGSEAVVRAMAAVAIVQAAESVLWPVMLAAHKQVQRLAIAIAGTVLSLILNVVLIPRMGVNGAILASFISFTLIVVLTAITLRDALSAGTLWRAFLSLAGGALAAAIAAIGTVDKGQWVAASASIATFIALTALTYWRSRAHERRTVSDAAAVRTLGQD
jgi:O-antigen/teichoic acid export membrane protein